MSHSTTKRITRSGRQYNQMQGKLTSPKVTNKNKEKTKTNKNKTSETTDVHMTQREPTPKQTENQTQDATMTPAGKTDGNTQQQAPAQSKSPPPTEKAILDQYGYTISEDAPSPYAPHDAPLFLFIDPTVPMVHMKQAQRPRAHAKLPTEPAELLRPHYTPIPEGIRYLVTNVKVEGITELHESKIIGHDRAGRPMIETLDDCEWLHILLKHPRDRAYNSWRYFFIPTPYVQSVHILKQIKLFQLKYVNFARSIKGSGESQQLLSQLRVLWRLLPEAVQQWILQMLAPRTDAFPSLISAKHWIQGTNPPNKFLPQKDAIVLILHQVEYWQQALRQGFRDLPLYPHEAEKHDKDLTPTRLERVNQQRQSADGIVITVTREEKMVDPRMTRELSSLDSPEPPTRPEEPDERYLRALCSFQAKRMLRKRQLPPQVKPEWHPDITIKYWNKDYYYGIIYQWWLEAAWYQLQAQDALDESKYKMVSEQAHAGCYKYPEDIVDALRYVPPDPTAYGPARGQTSTQTAPRTTTDPYSMPATTPTTTRTTTTTTTTAGHSSNASNSTNRNKSKRRSSNVTVTTGAMSYNNSSQRPQTQPTTNKRRVTIDESKNQTNYYARHATNSNPRWQQQQSYYNNPTSEAELANNINVMFQSNTLPPRTHATMPSAPTGTVTTPAPATTPVTTRYPEAMPMTSFTNFTSSQLGAIDEHLSGYNYGGTPTSQVATSTPILTQASAHKLAELQGISLATSAITQGALTDLVVHDKVSPFQNLVVQMMKHENTLIDKTPSQQKKLLLKRQTSPDAIVKTLQLIYDILERHRSKLEQPYLLGQVTMTPTLNGQLIIFETRKRALKELIELVKVDIKDKLVPDIIKSLTHTFRCGWIEGKHMARLYTLTPRNVDKNLLAQQIQPLLTTPTRNKASTNKTSNENNYNNNQTNTPRARQGNRNRGGRGGRGGRNRGGGRGGRNTRSTNTRNTRASSSQGTVPAKLYRKVQQPQPVQGEPDPVLGYRIKHTQLKAINQYCNNYAVWSYCAAYDADPNACKYKHKCSNCNDQTHGRRDCPKELEPGEDRDA